MPVHPAEETTSGSMYISITFFWCCKFNQLTASGITDQVAKDSKDSNASTHELHGTKPPESHA
jgi:hypothetical protein